ncbi:transcriptional coactivator p15/PC4 family protein [Candidatus Bathyarchaeota archaeon]|nr:transcriptional coactivator p15/PC4 family protein [Candidatus Bathyarchaeota archaeon]
MHEASKVLDVGKRDKLVVAIHEFKGHFGVDILYYYTDQLNQLRPTHRGIRVPVDAALELIDALTEVLKNADEPIARVPEKKKSSTRKPARKTARK